MFYRSVGITSVLLLASVSGMPWPGPEPTNLAVDLAIEGRSPKPTGLAAVFDPAQIFRRDEETRTCGYVNGDFNNAATCSAAYYCAYNQVNGVFGCCTGALNTCNIETRCYPSSVVAISCDASCQANPSNRVCTYGTLTECRYFVYDLGTTSLLNYGCGPEPFTSFVYSTYTNSPQATSVVNMITWVTQGASSTATPAAASSAPATTNPSSTPTPDPSPKKPIGAIVGGVVGGLAVIVAFAFGIFFLLQKKKTKAHPAPTTDQSSKPFYPPQQPQPYMQQPMKNEGVYVSMDPKPPAMSETQPMNPHYSMSPPTSPLPPYYPNAGAAHAMPPSQHPGSPGMQQNVYEAPT